MAKKGISISSLLGPKDSNGDDDDDLVPISSSEIDHSPKKKSIEPNPEEVISIDDSDDDAPELLTKAKFEAPSTMKRTESGKIDIKSILTNNDNDSGNDKSVDNKEAEEKAPAPKKRRGRSAKKEIPEEVEVKPEPKKRAPRGSKKKAAAEAAEAKKEEEAKIEEESKRKQEEEDGKKTKDDKKEVDPPKTAGRGRGKSTTKDTAKESAKETANSTTKEEVKESTKDITNPAQESSKDAKEVADQPTTVKDAVKSVKKSSIVETPSKEHLYESPGPPVSSPFVLQSQVEPLKRPSKPSDIQNLMNNDDDKPQLLPSALPNDESNSGSNTAPSTTTAPAPPAPASTTSTTSSSTIPATKPKPKGQKKPATKPVAKKNDNKKTTPQETKQETPAPLTYNQIQNQNLIKPDPKANENLPPPKLIEIQKSPAQQQPQPQQQPQQQPQETTPQPEAKPTEPIIALHVPLKPSSNLTPTSEGTVQGATQVVFNVLKMAEDKYGWRNLHPEASKYALELMNDEDIDDDDDDEDDEKEEEEAEPQQRIDGRRLQKGKPKIGQYDKEDPFIDDSEMVWEEQRASTKDGFFVFYGPLVEEGKSAKIERADGTIKRSRKRPAAGSGGGAGGNNKKRATNSKQTTPKLLIPIAPANNNTITSSATNTTTNSASAPTPGPTPAPVDIAPKVQ